ncbi:MAG: arabinose efflux permease family protein [Ilumatobacteraceae bacterium]|nr:arabinose efflux permease family protein [Ilumatobacteraceae bacterium]
MSSHPFRPLRRRSVLLVWGSGLFSDVGTWVQLIVVGSLVAKDTGSALYTGLTALALFTPQGLCAPIGGLLADRYDRRRVFAAALSLQAVATAVLAVVLAMGVRNPLILSAIIVFSATGGALGQPAYSAMLPDLVPPEELMAMVALGIYSWNGGRILGPLIGTVMVATLGPAWTVGFNAISFAGMAVAVSLLRRAFMPSAADAMSEGMFARMREGWRAVRRVAGCQYGIVMIMILNLCVGPFMGLIPIYAREVFGGGTGMAGTFSAVQGVGAIIGGLLFTILAARHGRGHTVFVAATGLVLAYGVYALAPTTVVAGAAVLCLGAGSASIFTSAMAIVQRDAPAGQRGRVLSITQAAMGFCYGIGVLWISIVGDWVNMRVAFLAACIAVAVLASVVMFRTRGWRDVLDGDHARVDSAGVSGLLRA